jgi:hypothetical protein
MASPDEDRQAAPDHQAEHELRRANEEWAKALAQRDKAALERIMADDFTFAYPFEGDDKGQFINDVVAGVVRVESLEPRDATVRVFGGTGLVFAVRRRIGTMGTEIFPAPTDLSAYTLSDRAFGRLSVFTFAPQLIVDLLITLSKCWSSSSLRRSTSLSLSIHSNRTS